MRLTRRFFLVAVMGLMTACQDVSNRSSAAVDTAPESVKGNGEDPSAVEAPAVEEVLPRTVFVRIAKAAAPAVVHLKTAQNVRRAWSLFGPKNGEGPLQNLLQRFWGRPEELVLRQRSVGSGFLIHPAGYLLTNHHVVDRADAIVAVLSDGHEVPAHVVGRDSRVDLAILKIEGRGPFPVVDLGDSDRLEAGEWAMAVGSPFGLAQTFTVGVISATGRTHLGFASRENFIQTDASINYGNSGGPLLNIRGETVGINTAIMPWGRGIGFAIPINTARRFSEPILKKLLVKSAWLGIQIDAPRPDAQDGGGDVTVRSVRWGSPASRSGLRRGDRVIRLDETEVRGAEQLRQMIAESEIGAERTLTIIRSGSAEEIVVRPMDRPMRVSP